MNRTIPDPTEAKSIYGAITAALAGRKLVDIEPVILTVLCATAQGLGLSMDELIAEVVRAYARLQQGENKA